MARARNLKPGFFTNDELAECEPLARLLFAGLWTIADREGRLEDRPRKIKAEVLPYDECDPECLLDQLAGRGFIQRYEAAGFRLIQVMSFSKHQTPHIKEAASDYPAPDLYRASTVLASDDGKEAESSNIEKPQNDAGNASTIQASDLNQTKTPVSISVSTTESISISGEETDAAAPSKPSRRKSLTSAPDDFPLTEDHYLAAAELGLDRMTVDRETRKFVLHYQANGKPMKDWQAAWQNWMIKVPEFERTTVSRAPQLSRPPSNGVVSRSDGVKQRQIIGRD